MKKTTNIFLCVIVCLLYIKFCNAQEGNKMILSSPVFQNDEFIPVEYTCKGSDINPELNINNTPEEAKSLALIVDDPDAPMGTWVHWVVFNIPVDTKVIDKNTVPGKQGFNDFRRENYGGPCPPSGTHRYFFKLYALDTILDLNGKITKSYLEKAMQGHILDKAELVGLFKK